MERIYIEGNMARFTRKGLTLVDMELRDGTKLESLEPRRLFPVSQLDNYITLLDESGAEQAVIRDLNTLPEDQKALISSCLQEYYLIPKITKITDVAERFDGLTLYTETDRGPAQIEIRILLRGFKMQTDRRLLIRDINDNRYEVPDVRRLDRKSLQILGQYI